MTIAAKRAGEFDMCRSALAAIFYAAAVASIGSAAIITDGSAAQVASGVDEGARVTLAGNTRPEAANARNDRGLVSDSFRLDHILLQLKRSPKSEHRLTRLIAQLYDSRSPNYHAWLTAADFGHEFGPAPGDLKILTGWLKAKGFAINAIYASGMVVDFSGTAGQVRRAFSAPIHSVDAGGGRHIANIEDPQIPQALSSIVSGIVSLHDFRPSGMFRPRSKAAFRPGPTSAAPFVPADLATIYDIKPLFAAGIAGKGETIAVVEDSDLFSVADWNRFRSEFGLAKYSGSLANIHPNAPTSHNDCRDPGITRDDVEATLDAEWASAAAPAARIEVASCANTQTTFGGLIALENLINSAAPPPVISVSYGECEPNLGAAGNAAYNALFQQAAAEGVSVFVAAGNGGAANCDTGQWAAYQGVAVNGLASTPFNVAVGGTDFADAYLKEGSTYWSMRGGSGREALSYVPEIPWNDSCAGSLGAIAASGSPVGYGLGGFCNTNMGAKFWQVAAGGGGPSGCAFGARDLKNAAATAGSCSGYAKPYWQEALPGVPADGLRDLPDVSLFAGDGAWSRYYALCWSDGRHGGTSCAGLPSTWVGAGGTSFAAPVMAAIQALVDEKAGSPQGNPNPVYYALAGSQYGAAGDSECSSSLGNAVSSGCIFHDVGLGDSDVNCTSAEDMGLQFTDFAGPVDCRMEREFMGALSAPGTQYRIGYAADRGWDFATGLGTVDAANLVNAWR